MTLLDGQRIRQSFSSARNSDYKIRNAGSIPDNRSCAVPKDIVLTPISFRYSGLIETGKDFVAIWIPVGLSSALSQ